MLRKIYIQLSIALIFTFFVQNCTSDYDEELSGNYFYEDEGGELHSIVSHLPNRIGILPTVLDYDYNKDFILAVQQPYYQSCRDELAGKLNPGDYYRSTEDIIKFQKLADSLIKYDAYYQKILSHKINYWIISNKENHVYGPLTLKEYFDKRKELHIPENLTIKTGYKE